MPWLEEESEGYDIVKIIVVAVVLNFVWSVAAVSVMEITNHTFSKAPTEVSASVPSEPEGGIEILTLYFPLWLYTGAAIEEFLYRLLPLLIAIVLFGTSRLVLLVAIASSIIFGSIHGGYDHILLQGVGGFIYCIVFLKCGGFDGNFIKAFFSSTTAHFLFNALVIGLAVIFGGGQYLNFN